MTAKKAAKLKQQEDGREENPVDLGGTAPAKTAGDARMDEICSSGESNTRKRSASGLPARYKDSLEVEVEVETDPPPPRSGQGSGQEESKPTTRCSATGCSAQKCGKACKAKPARPEGDAACPRCQSDNTKFCYFNNGNVKQPRYFCKACLRYWTAGGILRNIPPGAGKRKSKASATRESEKAATAAAAKQVQQHAQQMAQQAAMRPPLRFTVPHGADLVSSGAGAAGEGDQMRFMMDPMAVVGAAAWAPFPGVPFPPGIMSPSGLGLAPGGVGGFGMGLDMGGMPGGPMAAPLFAYPFASASAPVPGGKGGGTSAPTPGIGPGDAPGTKQSGEGGGEGDRCVRPRLAGDCGGGDQPTIMAQMAAAQAQLQHAAALQAQAHMQAAAAQWGQTQGACLASSMAGGMSGGMAAAPMWPFAVGPGYGMGGLPPTPWGPMGQMPRFSSAPTSSFGASTVVQSGEGRAPAAPAKPPLPPGGHGPSNQPCGGIQFPGGRGGSGSGGGCCSTPAGAAPCTSAPLQAFPASQAGGMVYEIGANGVVGDGSSGNLMMLPGWGCQAGSGPASGVAPLQGMGWPMAEEGQAPHMMGKPFGGATAVAHGSVFGGQGSLHSGGSGNSGATGFPGAP